MAVPAAIDLLTCRDFNPTTKRWSFPMSSYLELLQLVRAAKPGRRACHPSSSAVRLACDTD
jgi:hypothetical protein